MAVGVEALAFIHASKRVRAMVAGLTAYADEPFVCCGKRQVFEAGGDLKPLG